MADRGWAKAFALAALCSAAGFAGQITFVVNGNFDTGATFSGTFTIESSTRTMVDSNIVTMGEPGFAGATYTSAGTGDPYLQGNNPSAPNDFSPTFISGSSVMFFWLAGDPSTFTGGNIQALGASCGPGQCTPSREFFFSGGSRNIVSGTVEAVPEPATGALAIMSLCGSYLLRRRYHRRRP